MVFPFLYSFLLFLAFNLVIATTFVPPNEQGLDDKTKPTNLPNEAWYLNLPELSNLKIPEEKREILRKGLHALDLGVSSLLVPSFENIKPGVISPEKTRLLKDTWAFINFSCEIDLALNLADYEKYFVPQAILERYLSEKLPSDLYLTLYKVTAFVRSLRDPANRRTLTFLSKLPDIYAGYFLNEILVLPPESHGREYVGMALMKYAFIEKLLDAATISPDISLNQIVFGGTEILIDPLELLRIMNTLAKENIDEAFFILKSALIQISANATKVASPNFKVFGRKDLESKKSFLKDKMKELARQVYDKRSQKPKNDKKAAYLFLDIPGEVHLEPLSLKNSRAILETKIIEINQLIDSSIEKEK
jgi:hypothetical protein